MLEISKNAKIEEEAVTIYIVNGISDRKRKKASLYECKSIRALKRRLKTYALVNNGMYNTAGVKLDYKSVQSKDTTGGENRVRAKAQQKSGAMHCFNCGDANHKSAECPNKSKGPKCYRCNEFGHLSSDCKLPAKLNRKEPEKTVLFTTKKEDRHMCVAAAYINSRELQALVDTGSDVNLIRYDAAIDFGMRIRTDSESMKRWAVVEGDH